MCIILNLPYASCTFHVGCILFFCCRSLTLSVGMVDTVKTRQHRVSPDAWCGHGLCCSLATVDMVLFAPRWSRWRVSIYIFFTSGVLISLFSFSSCAFLLNKYFELACIFFLPIRSWAYVPTKTAVGPTYCLDARIYCDPPPLAKNSRRRCTLWHPHDKILRI